MWEKDREKGRKSEVDRVWRMKAKWGKNKEKGDKEVSQWEAEGQRGKDMRKQRVRWKFKGLCVGCFVWFCVISQDNVTEKGSS